MPRSAAAVLGSLVPDEALCLTGAALTKAIKAKLREVFPACVFTVRADRGSAYGWWSIGWTDGPSEAAVTAVVERFQSSRFDGMTDGYERVPAYPVSMSDGSWVRGGARGITTTRRMSPVMQERLKELVALIWEIPVPVGDRWCDAVVPVGSGGQVERFATHVHQLFADRGAYARRYADRIIAACEPS